MPFSKRPVHRWFFPPQAGESIGEPLSGGAVYLMRGTNKSTCSDNPWVNKNASCTPIQSSQTIPGPYPRTAVLINDSQRQALKQQEQAQLIIPTPEAPVIQSPPANKVYLVPAKIPLKVQHKPAFNVIFEFMHNPSVKKPEKAGIPDTYGVTKVVLDNVKTYAGITTAELNTSKTGR